MLYSMVPWFYRHRQSVTIPVIKSFFETLKKEKPKTKLGVAGFCWGGRYALLVGQSDFASEHLVDAVFTGHPSLLSIPDDIKDPYCPISVAVAGNDTIYGPKHVEQTKKVWEKSDGIETEFVMYDGAEHGFCVRGNMKDPKQKEDMVKAIDQVCMSFQRG